jgi:hypothetical protein
MSVARGLRALVLAAAARDAVRPGRRGRVVLCSGSGGYARLGDDFVLLGAPRAPVGPLSLIVAGLRAGDLVIDAPVRCDDGTMSLGDLALDLRTARVRRAATVPPASASSPGALAAALGAVPDPPAGLAPGLRALARGELDAGTRLLGGRGDGLTPAGDDVLAGYAAWRHADGRPVSLRAETSALSRAYLRRAELGELPDAAIRVRDAIRRGDLPASRAAARALRTWGASSGFALLWGMAAGAQPTGVSGLRPL